MDGEIRNIPGDRLVSRIYTRVRRRPRLGLSPDFYARFGMDDPWSAPELVDEQPASDGMVFLSAQPYYAMLRRLAAARKRRERRAAAFAERHTGTRAHAVGRAWPGESAASLAVSRVARLALEDMTLPPPLPAATASTGAAPAQPVVTAAAAPAHVRTPRTRSVANAWHTTPFVPARVFRGSDAEAPRASASSHAGDRLARAAAADSATTRLLEGALPPSIGNRQHAVARVAAIIESLPPEQRQVEIRRVVRRLGGAGPLVRTVFEDTPAVDTARPVHTAARRMAPVGATGLRPVLSRSPGMALAAAPELDRAASGTLATAERAAGARALATAPRRVVSAQAALARASAGAASAGSSVPAPLAYARAVTTAALAASPVVRPAPAAAARGAAPRASAPALRADPAAASPRSSGGPSPASRDARRDERSAASSAALVRGPDAAERVGETIAPRLSGYARVLARVAAVESLPPGSPGRSGAPPAGESRLAAVRTLAGGWAPARLVPEADRDDAVPAANHALRSSSVAHAATRVEAGQAEGRSVLPRAIPAAPDRVLPGPSQLLAQSGPARAAPPAAGHGAVAARSTHAVAAWGDPSRPSASVPVRTAAGAYVPARTFRTPDSLGSGAGASASVRASVRGVAPVGTPALPTGARADAGETAAPGGTRSPAGAWAASRADRPPGSPVVAADTRPGDAARPPTTRALPSSAFRTPIAEPAAASPGSVASDSGSGRAIARRRTTTVYADAGPSASRTPGIVHAAQRAGAAAAPVTSAVDARGGRPGLDAPDLRIPDLRIPDLRTPDLRTPDLRTPDLRTANLRTANLRTPNLRTPAVRVPAMAHASARTELPADAPTLQPRVSPVPGTRAPAADLAAAVALLTATRSPRPARVAHAASAAARLTRSPLLSRAGAQALADTVPAAGAAAATAPKTARFARSGPLSFALPPLAASVAADAGAARSAPAGASRRERPTRMYTTQASAYAPTSAVTTPAGVWISARAAAATPGLRLLRTEAGRLVALAPAPGAPSSGAVAAGAASQGAGSPGAAVGTVAAARRPAATAGATFARPIGTVLSGDDAGPSAPPRQRPTDWAGSRHRVGDATAYRGAYRTPELQAEGSSTLRTPMDTGTASRTPARRDRPRRLAATAGEMALPTPLGAAPSRSGAVAADAPARRASFEDRLQAVAEGRPDSAAPGWAARADGSPRVRSPGGLFEALARASTTEEIVRVIFARADGVRETPLATEAPVVQVIEQIRQEVRREQVAAESSTRPSRLDAPSAKVLSGSYVEPVASTTRVRRGGVRGVGATARSVQAGSGDDRIMKLVKKLQGLIHLAEAEGRLADARSQVRMAEDSPGARAEAAGPVGASKEKGDKRESQDIESLGREVLEVVTRELELRRSRRMEDHDESSWW